MARNWERNEQKAVIFTWRLPAFGQTKTTFAPLWLFSPTTWAYIFKCHKGWVRVQGEKCTYQEFEGNGVLWLVTKWVLHQSGFTLQPIFLWMRNSSMDEEMTWLSTWQRFSWGELCGGRISWATSNPRTRNLASKRTPTWVIFLVFFKSSFPSWSPYQMTLS